MLLHPLLIGYDVGLPEPPVSALLESLQLFTPRQGVHFVRAAVQDPRDVSGLEELSLGFHELLPSIVNRPVRTRMLDILHPELFLPLSLHRYYTRFGTPFECRDFDAGDLRKPTRCVLKRLEGYVFPRVALVVTERIVKIPD